VNPAGVGVAAQVAELLGIELQLTARQRVPQQGARAIGCDRDSRSAVSMRHESESDEPSRQPLRHNYDIRTSTCRALED
jgi:hypothetical protein